MGPLSGTRIRELFDVVGLGGIFVMPLCMKHRSILWNHVSCWLGENSTSVRFRMSTDFTVKWDRCDWIVLGMLGYFF